MAIEPISWKQYLQTRPAPVLPPPADSVLTIYQDGAVRSITYEQLIEALAVETGRGTPLTVAVETNLLGIHGTLLPNPADGAVVPLHLPAYGTVSARKGYLLKNIGQGIARLDTPDGKTINGAAQLDLNPGDSCEIIKNGANWITI
jgi:hypothetical protein